MIIRAIGPLDLHGRLRALRSSIDSHEIKFPLFLARSPICILPVIAVFTNAKLRRYGSFNNMPEIRFVAWLYRLEHRSPERWIGQVQLELHGPFQRQGVDVDPVVPHYQKCLFKILKQIQNCML